MLPHISPARFDSLTDIAVIPYVLRLELLGLDKMRARRVGVASWWERVRNRPSTDQAIFKRMTDADAAPFKNLQPAPRSKVRELLETAGARKPRSLPADLRR